jgi:3-hydroxyisobutyrate dehydrogenase-like beta-hydroxyacid dehydrogenase
MDSARARTIAIIGAGEMGAAVGRRMRQMGARVLTTLKDRSAASAERVRDAGLEIIADDSVLAREAGYILSIVPPGQAHAVAERFRRPLSAVSDKPVFADCNAVSAATAVKIAATIAPTGCRFVDAGIIGGPPPIDNLMKGPRFYASGEHAAEFAPLRDFGLDIAVLYAPIGAASALKLSYSGITKGLIALGAAMITAAQREGLGAALHAELERSQPHLLSWLGRGVPNLPRKAYRWVAEMEEIGSFLGDIDSGSGIYEGAARLFEHAAKRREHEGDAAFASLIAFLARTSQA